MFPVLGRRFAVEADLQAISCMADGMIRTADRQLRTYKQWLYAHLMAAPKDVLSHTDDAVRDEFLHDCIRLQVLRLVLDNIPLPVQKSSCLDVISKLMVEQKTINLYQMSC